MTQLAPRTMADIHADKATKILAEVEQRVQAGGPGLELTAATGFLHALLALYYKEAK